MAVGRGSGLAARQAAKAGFAGETVGCEPTGHRWQILGKLVAERGIPFVCTQTLLVAWARRNEDLTNDTTDDRDAMLIGRLVGELRCYEGTGPRGLEPAAAFGSSPGASGRGGHREVQQMRDLLECAWPAVLDAAAQPFKSATWKAAVDVVLSRCGGELAQVRRLGEARFQTAVRRQLPRWGTARPCLQIVRAVYAALSDPTGVNAARPWCSSGCTWFWTTGTTPAPD